jgi:hypothetical protein
MRSDSPASCCWVERITHSGDAGDVGADHQSVDFVGDAQAFIGDVCHRQWSSTAMAGAVFDLP